LAKNRAASAMLGAQAQSKESSVHVSRLVTLQYHRLGGQLFTLSDGPPVR
jgi:hypothetical protein